MRTQELHNRTGKIPLRRGHFIEDLSDGEK
jgi:hypothetical protein